MDAKLQTKVKVAVRVRPVPNHEDRSCVSTDKSTVSIFNQKNIKENITYKFPTVFDLNTPQKDVYSNLVQPEVKHILEGKNVSVFAYGGTGSGKTHTMLGSPVDPGIIPRLIQDLFESFVGQTEHSYEMTISYLEIYNEKIRDLITSKNENLTIREDYHQNIFVPNLTEREVGSFEDFSKIFGSSSGNRTSAKTDLNANSSRSHSILLLKVIKTELCTLKQCHISKVSLVDMAGSENNRFTGNEGLRFKESALINKSLLSFADVMSAINQGNRQIPFRNSKLTRLLQNSLTGSSHVLLIANIAPEEQYYHNTYCTLNFASKHKKIVENPSVCELATAYNIKLPNSKRKNLTEKDEKPKISSDSVKKLESNSLPSDKSKARVEDLMQQMLKVEQSLKSRSLLNVKVSPKKERPETQKTQTKDCKEKMRRHTMMKDDLRSRLKGYHVKRRKSENLEKLPSFKENTKRETTSRYLRSMTTKDDYELIENKQKNHRDHVLKMLNSQCENDLMLLHTVGKRRAQMIVEWTQHHEPFQQIEDLAQIPDIGTKYLTQFLRQNHLTNMDKENM